MKKIIALLFVAALSVSLYAQGQAGPKGAQKGPHGPKFTPEEQAKRISDTLTVKLGLNETQKGQVYTLALTKSTKMKELREKHRAEMKLVRDEFHTGVKQVLTAEQTKKWTELKAQRKANPKKCSPGTELLNEEEPPQD